MKKITTLLFSISLFSTTAVAADKAMTLKEAVTFALERNLDVQVERYNPAQYEADIAKNSSIYDPTLNLQTSYGADATKWSASTDVDNFTINSSISQLFWTGGTASLSFSNSYAGTPNTSNWQSKLGANISQPLLKNTGRDATELAITVSKLNKYASLEKLKTRILSLVAQVKTEYYKLYTVKEQLDVKKFSLSLAEKILKETKARVAAGVLPAMEILNAEYGVVTREKDVIDAEKGVKDQNDTLKLLLQIEDDEIVPLTAPNKEKIAINSESAIASALLRPDVRELKRNLESNDIQLKVYKNRLLPDLSLIASAGITGRDDSFGKDMEKLGTFDHPVWSVGVNLTYPLGNSGADNDYRKSRLKSEQIALQIKSVEESIKNEVKVAARAVDSSYKQIEVAERSVAFAEERLRAFVKKNEVGLATTKDVLDVENDLAAAKNNKIASIVSYNNAVVAFQKTTGELLQIDQISVVDAESEKIYKATASK